MHFIGLSSRLSEGVYAPSSQRIISKRRGFKIQFEAYAAIAPYPPEYVKLKNACLKWTWVRAGPGTAPGLEPCLMSHCSTQQLRDLP